MFPFDSVLPLARGFGVGFGLIVAIGAQNAYILARGINRNHHWLVAMMASIIDTVLIFAGILGLGQLVEYYPGLLIYCTIGGVLFLFGYGFFSFKQALSPGHLRSNNERLSLKTVVLSMLAISLFNPHLYLDTVVLLGSVAVQEKPDDRLIFGVGAATASFLWFHLLALGGQWMQRWFQSPKTWRILDIVIGLTMWSIALMLVWPLLWP